MDDRASVPQTFKGIALFTPGGDLVYCIDSEKQRRWHLHLCAALQKILCLPEPPHFLVPGYTATVDRWTDPRTKRLQCWAEAYPLVMRHQVLLNAAFALDNCSWHIAPWSEDVCNPMAIATYRDRFPQLWEENDLLVRVNDAEMGLQSLPRSLDRPDPIQPQGYVLRLFVSGYSPVTERTLQKLHQVLERSLGQPYTLKVVDIVKHPEEAETHHISATPTLLKIWPPPVRQIVGEFSGEKLFEVLGYLQA